MLNLVQAPCVYTSQAAWACKKSEHYEDNDGEQETYTDLGIVNYEALGGGLRQLNMAFNNGSVVPMSKLAFNPNTRQVVDVKNNNKTVCIKDACTFVPRPDGLLQLENKKDRCAYVVRRNANAMFQVPCTGGKNKTRLPNVMVAREDEQGNNVPPPPSRRPLPIVPPPQPLPVQQQQGSQQSGTKTQVTQGAISNRNAQHTSIIGAHCSSNPSQRSHLHLCPAGDAGAWRDGAPDAVPRMRHAPQALCGGELPLLRAGD